MAKHNAGCPPVRGSRTQVRIQPFNIAMGVIAKIAPKFAALVVAVLFGTLLMPSYFRSGCAGSKCGQDDTPSPGMADTASEIDWVSRAAFKAGIASATRAIRSGQTAEPTQKLLLVGASQQPSAVSIGGRRQVQCSALAATALASPPPSAAAVSRGDIAASPAPYSHSYVVTLQRDVLRVEHVRNLTSVDLHGGNIVWAIDGMSVSDQQVEMWQHEG